ncbi:response regulator [Dethiosulfatibacter aminovorans]|nr:response regulator [Dethiosulfatibacter aminovorans]
MDTRIYIVDDDAVIRKLLKNIINEFNLGEIIGEADNGKDAVRDIKMARPDIVLVDLLLPDIDGISIVSTINEAGLGTSFIMISQVDTSEMIAQAYDSRVEFYIKKPINAREVYSVVNNVKEKRKMKKIIEDIDRAVSGVGALKEYLGGAEKDKASDRDKIRNIFYQLGIAGDTGGSDIVEIILMIRESRELDRLKKYKMYELYEGVSQKYSKRGIADLSARSIEQRVRRTIGKALKNIANLGIEDYESEIFNRYSNTLFDFEEVRNEMNYLQKRTKYNGKVNIKKFIEGIIIEINR